MLFTKKVYYQFLGLVVWHLCMSIHSSLGKSAEFTVSIESGSRECFYEQIKGGLNFEFEYQVIEGGDFTVNFAVQDPAGNILVQDIQKQDNLHKLTATIEGEYKFCFDNVVNSFAKKLVFFELMTNDPEVDSIDWDNFSGPQDTQYDVTVENFRTALDKVKLNLEKTIQSQAILRVFETRDRSAQEGNYDRVNFWSLVHLVLMVLVAAVQVYMIRSLFGERRTGPASTMKAQT